MPWPPRSPDLSMCDFFLWGFLKSIVYRRPLQDINELKVAITEAFQQVTVTMLEKAALDYRRRLHKCLENDGGHVEITVIENF